MKYYFSIALLVFLAWGCGKSEVEESIIDTTDAKKVTFIVGGDWQQMGTRAKAVSESDMTDMWVFDYMNGTIMESVHFADTDEGFSSPSLTLKYGAHDLYIVASKGESSEIDETKHQISWETPHNTFWKTLHLEVDENSADALAVTLDCMVTELCLVIDDEVPEDVATISVAPSKWYYGMDYLTGEPLHEINNHEITTNIPASKIGTKGKMATSIYGFSSATEWTTDVTVMAKNSNGDLIGKSTIVGVPFSRNIASKYHGNLFAIGRGDSLNIDDTWQMSYEEGVTFKPYSGNTYNLIGFKAIGTLRTGQSAAVFGDIAFIFGNGGQSGGRGAAFNMKTRTVVSNNIPINGVPSRTGGTAWHCNSSEFGTNYYDKNDEFPLLYIGGSQDDAIHELLVCRVVPDNSIYHYHIDVVQVLTMPDDWGYANVAFDKDRGKIILCRPDMIFRVCTPPAVVDGEGNPISTYTFTEEDCEQTITIDAQRLSVPQDVAMHRGLLYHVEGHGAKDNGFFRVIDLYNGILINDVSVAGWFTDATEGISFYNEHLFLFNTVNIYKFWFL